MIQATLGWRWRLLRALGCHRLQCQSVQAVGSRRFIESLQIAIEALERTPYADLLRTPCVFRDNSLLSDLLCLGRPAILIEGNFWSLDTAELAPWVARILACRKLYLETGKDLDREIELAADQIELQVLTSLPAQMHVSMAQFHAIRWRALGRATLTNHVIERNRIATGYKRLGERFSGRRFGLRFCRIRRREAFGIRVTGTTRFIRATEDALGVLERTSQWRRIADNIRSIRETDMPPDACIKTSCRKGKVLVCWRKLRHSHPAVYASILVHEARHNELGRVAKKQTLERTDFEVSQFSEEIECVTSELECLKELNAPERIIEEVECELQSMMSWMAMGEENE